MKNPSIQGLSRGTTCKGHREGAAVEVIENQQNMLIRTPGGRALRQRESVRVSC